MASIYKKSLSDTSKNEQLKFSNNWNAWFNSKLIFNALEDKYSKQTIHTNITNDIY